MSTVNSYIPSYKKLYKEQIEKELMKEFGYKNPMEVPKLKKIVVSMGLGDSISNKKLMNSSFEEISLITSQRPVRTKSRQSVSNFKIRKGMDIGLKVTLRDKNMYEFMYKLINIAIPRVKDFRGLNPNNFDGYGNYSFGITEQIIFPEIDYDKIEKISGFNIAFVTTANTDKEAQALLSKFGMPFSK